MKDLNKIMLSGRLGADPDMRFTPQGTAQTTMRIACNRAWTDKDGTAQQETEWFRVVAWGKLAETCNEYLAKGRRAMIEGRLQTRAWTDRDGNERQTTEVVASEVYFLDTRTEPRAPAAPENQRPARQPGRRSPTQEQDRPATVTRRAPAGTVDLGDELFGDEPAPQPASTPTRQRLAGARSSWYTDQTGNGEPVPPPQSARETDAQESLRAAAAARRARQRDDDGPGF